MYRIERIEPLKSGRYLIYLEDETSFPLYGKEMAAYGIEEDAVLEDGAYAEIMLELLPKRAKRKAMYLLQSMDRTESQLRQKLKDCQYPPEIVDDAVEYVKSFHYIDDVRYARAYMECRKDSRSMRRILQELYQKGVSRADAETASRLVSQPDEEQQIRGWIEKKRFCAETADRKETDRFIAFLLRKGYSLSKIQNVLR